MKNGAAWGNNEWMGGGPTHDGIDGNTESAENHDDGGNSGGGFDFDVTFDDVDDKEDEEDAEWTSIDDLATQ